MLPDLSLPALHAHLMAMPIPAGDTVDQQQFYLLLLSYQQATTPASIDQVATTADRRAIRLADRLPMDLINAYDRLVRLARWRARQLREDADARR